MLTLTRDHKYPVVGLCEHLHFYDVGWGCISGLHPGGLMGDETGAKRCTGMGNSHGDRPQIRDATSTLLFLSWNQNIYRHGSWSPQHTLTLDFLDYDTS